MTDIYRRYNANMSPTPQNTTSSHSRKQQILRETAPAKSPSSHSAKSGPVTDCKTTFHNGANSRTSEKQQHKSEFNHTASSSKNSVDKLLRSFLPPSLYNRETKKILGFLTSEDLLLIALILLLSENDSEDETLTILALLYILLSDYINLPDLSI